MGFLLNLLEKQVIIMANISDASGTVKIKAQDVQSIIDLLILQDNSEQQVYYPTTIGDYNWKKFKKESEKRVQASTKRNNNGVYEFNTFFTAVGRWNFESNVNWFFDFLKPNDKDTEKIKQLKEKTKYKTFCVYFDFVDAEPGCDFITKGKAETNWLGYYGQNIVHYDIEEETDYTLENLEQMMGDVDPDWISIQYLIDYFDDLELPDVYVENKWKILEILEDLDYKESIWYSLEELEEAYPELQQLIQSKTGCEE